MKRQNTSSRHVIIRITFFAALLIMAACKEGKEPVQHTTVALRNIDIHTTVMTVDKKAARENAAAEFIFNENDPRGSSSLSPSPWLFLFFPFTFIITTGR